MRIDPVDITVLKLVIEKCFSRYCLLACDTVPKHKYVLEYTRRLTYVE